MFSLSGADDAAEISCIALRRAVGPDPGCRAIRRGGPDPLSGGDHGRGQGDGDEGRRTFAHRRPRVAFTAFGKPDGGFIERDLYVFVIDLTGRIWFNAVFPTPPGRNILGSRDSKGRYFVQEMIAVAQADGEGWVEYEWFSPCTGKMAAKSAYVVRVGPLLVAVGAYGVVSL